MARNGISDLIGGTEVTTSTTEQPKFDATLYGAAAVGASATVQTAEAVGNNNNRNKTQQVFAETSSTIFDREFAMATRINSLSSAAMSVVDEITTQFKKLNESRPVNTDPLEISYLAETNGYLVFAGNIGVVLLFEESVRLYGSGDFSPKTRYVEPVRMEAEKVRKDVCILMSYLITPDMYDSYQVSKIITKLVNVIRLGASSQSNITMFRNCRFRINSRMEDVVKQFNEVNPGTVLPYMQYGITFDKMEVDNNTHDRRLYGNLNTEKWATMFAVGGYTEFVMTNQTTTIVYNGQQMIIPRYRPVIIISAASISLDSVKMLPIIVPTAYDAFYVQGLWQKPFRLTEKSRDLGLLFSDENGNPLEISNQNFWDMLMNTMAEPIVMLETSEGAFDCLSFAGLGAASDENAAEFICKQCAEFLTLDKDHVVNPANIPNPLFDIFGGQREDIRYTGSVLDSGVEVDSRSIDYFKVVKTMGNVAAGAERMRNVTASAMPDAHLRLLADIGYREQDSRYITKRVVLNNSFIMTLAQGVVNFINVQSGLTNDSNRSIYSPDMYDNIVRENRALSMPAFGVNGMPMFKATTNSSGWKNASNITFNRFLR